jgi:IS6 family transposase
MGWSNYYGNEYLKPTNDSYRTDETFIKVKGQWKYLYRAVDSMGKTIDFMLSENRDKQAAKHFFAKALSSPHNQLPRVITLEKNQLILQHYKKDHRFIKKITKPMLGFKTFLTAEQTFKGIEAMHMKRKGQAENNSSLP